MHLTQIDISCTIFRPGLILHIYFLTQLKTGVIGEGGYVPDGLTASQYNKIRADAAAKKEANYQRNVKKAGIFEDFTEFYKKRGTGEGGNWLKQAGRGHAFVKTKYDWSGEKDDTKKFS